MPRVGDVVIVHSPRWQGPRPGLVTWVWSADMINVIVFGDGSYDDFDTARLTSIERGDGTQEDPNWMPERERVGL